MMHRFNYMMLTVMTALSALFLSSLTVSLCDLCKTVLGGLGYYQYNVMHSAGFRIYEALCKLSYEAPYLGPEGGRPGRPTQAVRHTCPGKLGIVKTLRYIR
jgi:hypothetical protein